MNMNSAYMKAIKGVVVINVDKQPKLYSLDDMQHSQFFGIGQLFNAVADLNGKTPSQYGKLWPKFRDQNDEVSKEWQELSAKHNSRESDYSFLVEICKQLQEEVPEILPRNEVQKRLDEFNMNSALFVAQNLK